MSDELWRFQEMLAAMRGRSVNADPAGVSGISIDSRSIAPGDAFFAITGDKFDGHSFVTSAVGHGAATCVISEAKLPSLGRITGSMIVVEDVLQGLGDLGRAARERVQGKIAAVTGSVGKTTTKEMLLLVLARQGKVHGAVGSFNNHWGVPLTLSRMPADVNFGVFEVGMNHAGEITPLSRMIQPHVAVITTVEPVHLEHFPSVEAIAEAKAEIFSGVASGGAAVINRDNPHYELLRQRAVEAGVQQVVGFGQNGKAEARLEDFVLSHDSSMVAARVLGVDVTYTLGAPGRHLIDNSLAVLAAVGLLGGNIEEAARTLETMTPPKGRGVRAILPVGDGGTALLIDESYNANPASMRAAIAVLGQSQPAAGGRRLAVLGDMFELGEAEMKLHAGLVGPLTAAGIDRVYLAGPRMAALREVLPERMQAAYAEEATELLPVLTAEIAAGDVVMVKGSNGMRMGPLVESLQQAFRRDPGGDA
jgi:UDP-N-acetylmuramoyl-tripeptide--D-alanyl-D-alanine ligase